MKYVVQVVMFVEKLADWVARLSWVTDEHDTANSDEKQPFFHAPPCTSPCLKGDSLVENSAQKSRNFSSVVLWLEGLSDSWL